MPHSDPPPMASLRACRDSAGTRHCEPPLLTALRRSCRRGLECHCICNLARAGCPNAWPPTRRKPLAAGPPVFTCTHPRLLLDVEEASVTVKWVANLSRRYCTSDPQRRASSGAPMSRPASAGTLQPLSLPGLPLFLLWPLSRLGLLLAPSLVRYST